MSGAGAGGVLPFQSEYAKSGRAKCRGCKEQIGAGDLRMAVMVQSAFFDGKQPNWYHYSCFFAKQRPKTVADIENFTTLRYEDQEKIKKSIESCGSGVVLPDVKGKKGAKGKKRSNGDSVVSALSDFAVEYSKSSRATCRVCEIKITKGEVRISKKVFDTEVGQKFGGQALWHHVTCFTKDRSDLMFWACGDVLPGFNSLKKEDKEMVKKELPAIKQDEVPAKKIKDEPKDKREIKKESEDEKILKEQNKLFYKYRDSLKNNLSKSELQSILEFNKQNVPPGEDRILNALADIMTFGAFLPCEVCKNGQLRLKTNGYLCSGDLTEWTKCAALTKTPKRTAFKIPPELKDNAAFKKYKFKSGVRVFLEYAPSSSQIVKTEDKKLDIPIPPLKNLQFFIYGYNAKLKEKLKIRILKLGGIVPSKINESLAAVVTTPLEVDKLSDRIEEAKDNNIQVVEDSFFDLIKSDGTVADSMKLIDEHNIAPWGSNVASRIPQDVVDGKSNKSKSMYSKASSGPTHIKLKGGTAVDPDSGLENVAHVYKEHKITYSVVLGLTDVVSQKNSFYKLQVLESDKKKKYWLFRSWGRIGTSIGGNKTETFHSVFEAIEKFDELYIEKTGNALGFGQSNNAPKIPGKMYPIDVDYGNVHDEQMSVDDGNSKLPKPVQALVKMFFDIDSMKQVMLQFELDTEKMPLGKLSRKQLTSGYKVLGELLKILSEGEESKTRQPLIIDATNRFYTLIPHSFGVENPPLLDNNEAINLKSSMLDNLLELEIAYTLLSTPNDDKTVSPLDSHYIKLKTDIVPIEVGSPEYVMLSNYVKNTHAATHSMYELEIMQVFKVTREGEMKRYKPFKKLHNRRLLWHGSRVTNFAGILSQGLRIAPPEAPVTGYMFGKGVYFADMVSKSANYCCTNVQNNVGVMLLCEVALGNMMELTAAKNVVTPKSGCHSVKGIGKTEPDSNEDLVLECGTIVPLGKPVTKKVKTQLLYNEYIVYDVAQVNVKYLFQMKFKYNF
ncbi:poly-(ADP-ribose) polymerase [Arctopsyche grandis]|uniref:poly-(ADP-ribose) polymerase n=1 Tax=Arctopsyche grandis TaxID=121162 RepID=UPI00406D956B